MKYLVLLLGTVFLLISCITEPVEQAPQEASVAPADSLAATSDRLVMALFDDPVEYKLAVLPFDNDGSAEAQTFSLILQDEIISAIFRTDLRNVVLFERTSLNRIIEEQQLSLSGMIENPAEIGKILSADQVVMGNIQDYGDEIRITARIIDVESGGIMNSVSESMALSRARMTVDAAEDIISEGNYDVMRLEFVIDYNLPENKIPALISMKDNVWIEYNSQGDQLLLGEYVITDDRTIEVTWRESYVESMIGGTTAYEYSFTDGIFILRIVGGNNLIGFIELDER